MCRRYGSRQDQNHYQCHRARTPRSSRWCFGSQLDLKSGTLIWTDGAIYGAEICFYRIEGRTQHNSTWVVLADMVQAENHELGDGIVIHGRREFFLNNKLSPYSSYEFRVAAYNKYSFPDTLACPTYYDANDPYNR